MTIDYEALLDLWDVRDIPACDEGMRLARSFLITCGEAVNWHGEENPVTRLAAIKADYLAMVEHKRRCEKCNEA